jgi:hypothetical protein
VCGFWGAGQGVTTRNGATAQGGAVLAKRRCDPGAGCGRRTRSRHPLRCPIPALRGPSCHALRRPIPRSYNAVLCHKKRAIYPVAQAHPKGEVQMTEKAFEKHSVRMKNERSTAGFRIIACYQATWAMKFLYGSAMRAACYLTLRPWSLSKLAGKSINEFTWNLEL